MNREEAHKKVKEWIDEGSKPEKIAKWHYGKVELHRDIDRLYDNFEKYLSENHHVKCSCSFCKPVYENQTCSNCKYFNPNIKSSRFSVCPRIGNTTVPSDFCCNRWESKC